MGKIKVVWSQTNRNLLEKGTKNEEVMKYYCHTSHDGVTKERLQTPGSLQYFDAWDNTKYSPEWGFSGNPRNLRFFWGKFPKTPQTLCYPRPKNFSNSFLGIFGDKTPINPKIEVIPVPKISPKVSNGLSLSPPRPQKSGRGRGNSGIGAPFYHTSSYPET